MVAVVKENEAAGTTARTRTAVLLLGAAVVAFTVALAWFGFGRDLFNYGTETDYLGSFVHEANRLLQGEPLEVDFHPPLYSIVIALIYSFAGDWLFTGLLLSLAAAFATLMISMVLLHKLLGIGAAIGGVAALMVSPTFLHFSTQATGDLFSLALYMGAFLAVYVSLERRSLPTYLVAGLIIGLGLLTRTNNIALLALLLFYLIPLPANGFSAAAPDARRALSLVAIAICIPVAAWFAFSSATGAPFMPTKNHENLALTYFSDASRLSGDARIPLAEQFTSTRQVLTEDPARIARTYVRDFATTTYRFLVRDRVLPAPLAAVSVLCWIGILLWERNRRLLLFAVLLNLAVMYALLNFKYYENRYYLFLLPFIGAAIGHVVAVCLSSRNSPATRFGALAVLLAVAGFALVKAPAETMRLHRHNWADDAFAAGHVLSGMNIPEAALIVARKPHIGFYANREAPFFPQSADLVQLENELFALREKSSAEVYVFYGREEQRTRSRLGVLAQPRAQDVGNLVLVAQGSDGGGWFFYRLKKPASGVTR